MPPLVFRFLRWCPGVVGLVLRQRLYRHLLGRCGRGVLIGRHVELINPGAIALGDQVIVNDGAHLDAAAHSGPEPGIEIGQGVFIGADTRLIAGPGRLTIDESSNIGSRCTIVALGDVTLGHHSLVAGYCTVGEAPGPGPAIGPATTAPVVIEPGCWLGLRCRVAAGVTIGEGTIVGAHAAVEAPLPGCVIALGRPATIARMRP